jgi:hypothetical protein
MSKNKIRQNDVYNAAAVRVLGGEVAKGEIALKKLLDVCKHQRKTLKQISELCQKYHEMNARLEQDNKTLRSLVDEMAKDDITKTEDKWSIPPVTCGTAAPLTREDFNGA